MFIAALIVAVVFMLAMGAGDETNRRKRNAEWADDNRPLVQSYRRADGCGGVITWVVVGIGLFLALAAGAAGGG